MMLDRRFAELEQRFTVDKILDNYEYAVRDPANGRPARLALFPNDEMVDGFPQLLERDWFRVQQASAHVLAALEVGRIEGASFAVTEWMDAPLLRELIATRRWSAVEVGSVMSDIADGVAALHRRGLLCFALAPDRILVGEEALKIDCCLAGWSLRLVRDRPAASWTHPVVPFLPYLAPEVIATQRYGVAADLFALGVILYELIAGHRPWVTSNVADLALAIQREPTPPLPDADFSSANRAPLNRFLARALAKDPQARIPTVDAFVGEMKQAIAATA
jgi:serine/threonine-protein kinase